MVFSRAVFYGNARSAFDPARQRAESQSRRSGASIAEYTGEILLVGINYDKKTKKHECVIEEYQN